MKIEEKTTKDETLPPKISSPIKIKLDKYGRSYTEDAYGNIIDGNILFKNEKIYLTKEFLLYYVYKTGIKDMIKRFLKKEVKDDIIRNDEIYSYIIYGRKNMPLLSIIFNASTHDFIRKSYSLTINAIISAEEFTYEQTEAIKSVIFSSRQILLNDPTIKKTKCTIKIETNI
ncbi:MAG: hypothetical protein KatS3mg002_0092 [Candidatus Woesearchaeota archaeon]|nr:MAG: hypothetical protein KatS3mg002_0092 [Candidatus Woesearchaeota archaeon]